MLDEKTYCETTLKFAISLQYEIPYGIELVFSFFATLFFPHSLNALVSICQHLLGH